MNSRTAEWRPGPSVCRCCLTEGCYKDISTEYFWMGRREVYAEMLAETFDLSIAYSKSPGPNSNSRLICEACIARLRDASNFKRQVKDCERTFHQHLDPASSSSIPTLDDIVEPLGKPVKIEESDEVKEEHLPSDDDDMVDDVPDFGDDDDDDDLDDQPLTRLASKTPKKEAVDITDLLDNAKAAVKRKSTSKTKGSPAKKAKPAKKEKAVAKAPKPPKKKKGASTQNDPETALVSKKDSFVLEEPHGTEKRPYRRSARAEARFVTKKNASAILECWSLCPFRWKKNRFKCAYCEDNFTDCSDLRDHVRLCSTQHSVKDIYSKFKEMTLINVDITATACKLCALPFSTVSEMAEHVIEHGFDFDSAYPEGVLPFALDKESWRCIICQDKFNNFLKLYEHMNSHYQHYICATCGKGYMTAQRLRKHSEVHISGTFPCDKCGKSFTMRAARDYHKAHAHAKGPRYECPQCDMRFTGYYERMNHLNEAHREKAVTYSCTYCEQTFKTSGKRAIHVRTVHFPQQRSFPCHFCSSQFKAAYELKRHMIKHTGERNFACTVCEKTFPRSKALRNHLKTHGDLSCKWCGLMFKQEPRLLAHIRTNHVEFSGLVDSPDKILGF